MRDLPWWWKAPRTRVHIRRAGETGAIYAVYDPEPLLLPREPRGPSPAQRALVVVLTVATVVAVFGLMLSGGA